MSAFIPPFFVVHSLVAVAPQTTAQTKILGYTGRVRAICGTSVLVHRVDNGREEIEPMNLLTRVG